MANKVLQLIKESGAKWVDFRFTDTKGKEQHVTYPADTIDEDSFEDGKMFDGSSIAGWKGIEASDMILRPDAETGFMTRSSLSLLLLLLVTLSNHLQVKVMTEIHVRSLAVLKNI